MILEALQLARPRVLVGAVYAREVEQDEELCRLLIGMAGEHLPAGDSIVSLEGRDIGAESRDVVGQALKAFGDRREAPLETLLHQPG